MFDGAALIGQFLSIPLMIKSRAWSLVDDITSFQVERNLNMFALVFSST